MIIIFIIKFSSWVNAVVYPVIIRCVVFVTLDFGFRFCCRLRILPRFSLGSIFCTRNLSFETDFRLVSRVLCGYFAVFAFNTISIESRCFILSF